MVQWDAIRPYLPDRRKGSRIVILTHQPVIASLCTGELCLVSELARFSPDHSVRVYFTKGSFMHELETNSEFDRSRCIHDMIHSLFHGCPRDLKKCMLYLSLFPEDIIIRRRRLVRRWVAEGYSKGTDNISMDKYAEKLFDKVAALSIMQPVVEASKVIGYRVNGFFREYILSRPVEERIFFPVEVSALEQGHGSLSTEGIGHHLAIGSTWEYDEVVLESLDFSRLRSLTVFNLFYGFYVSDVMRVLRVLDLENAKKVMDSHFEQIGKLPPRLKLLSLRGQKEVTRLPASVGELMQLQTLDIRDTSIVKLPPFITRLRKLQYFRAGTTIAWTHDDDSLYPAPPSRRSNSMTSRLLARFCRRGPQGYWSGGVEVPRGIKKLKALQTLGAIHVNYADGDAIENEMCFLRQLKKLEVCSVNHIHLPKNLRSLKMHGHVEQLPTNMRYHGHLMKLTLEKVTLVTPEDIEVLGSLPILRTLRLRVNNDGLFLSRFPTGEIHFPTGLFFSLEVLEIACKSKLHVRFDEQGVMEKLEQLKIHCLQGSEMQFSGLEHLFSVKQVWLLGYFDDALKEALQQQLHRHPKKPALKLEVQPSCPSEESRETPN